MPTSQPKTSKLFKDCYDAQYVAELCEHILAVWSGFEAAAFTAAVFDAEWQGRELKERTRHIAVCLGEALPKEYERAVGILREASWAGRGLENLALVDFVEVFGVDGQGDWEVSVEALGWMTRHASAEFAVRAFILKDADRMMQQMHAWANDENEHVRRLASEGCRPRLPWGQALGMFKKDPAAVLEILEILKTDQSEYVRKSVANNLNDISKDHPEVVLKVAKRWLNPGVNPGVSPGVGDQIAKTAWIVKHGCRTLLKAGRREALELFGYGQAKHVKLAGLKASEMVRIGDDLEFGFELTTQKTEIGKLRIEFVIDYMKANGKRAPKIFMIGQGEYKGQVKHVDKKHSFRERTVRKLYAGRHGLAIVVNGVEMGRVDFEVVS